MSLTQKVTVTLTPRQDSLWSEFNGHYNEMIVTKPGRKMFPKLEYNIKGLNPDKLYAMMLHIELADESRFKFSGGEWTKSGKAEVHKEPKKVWHADGVMSGRQWMMNPICFDRVKITNSVDKNNASMVFLHSMHKYVPVLSIYESLSESPFIAPQTSTQLVSTTKIDYTEFIAVTAYQNQTIIGLKIAHNPFAKGFREGSQSERKRRSPSGESTTEESSSQASSPQPKKARSMSSSPPLVPQLVPPMFPQPPINPFLLTPYFSQLIANGANLTPTFPFQFGFPCFSPLQFQHQQHQNLKIEKIEKEELKLAKEEPEDQEINII